MTKQKISYLKKKKEEEEEEEGTKIPLQNSKILHETQKEKNLFSLLII